MYSPTRINIHYPKGKIPTSNSHSNLTLSSIIKISIVALTLCSLLNIIIHTITFDKAMHGALLLDEERHATIHVDKLKIHHCINDDFRYKHKTSIWTMLNDNPSYVKSALKLGRALKKHTTKTDFDLVVMTLKNKPLSDESMSELKDVGFVNCVIDPIRPSHLEGKTRKDLQEKFGVLHVFAMTVYDTVLFLDADTFVQGPLDDLLNMDLGGKTIGVTKDIRDRKWVDTFNSGVMLLHPSEDNYNYLTKLLMDENFKFEYIMSDQGFLNAVYKDNWHEIGFLNNANLALYRFQRDFWDQHKLEDIRIIHYTMQKPWRCNAKGPYGPICQVWIDAE